MVTVIVLLFAMAVTSHALTMYTCYLNLGDYGWEETSSLTTVQAKTDGTNTHYSSSNMGLKMQYYYSGEWRRFASWSLPPDTWGYDSGWQSFGTSLPWRTKIYSPDGNVEGNGAIFSP